MKMHTITWVDKMDSTRSRKVSMIHLGYPFTKEMLVPILKSRTGLDAEIESVLIEDTGSVNLKIIPIGRKKALDHCPPGLFASVTFLGRIGLKTEFSDDRGPICYWEDTGGLFEPEMDPLDRGALLVQPMRFSL